MHIGSNVIPSIPYSRIRIRGGSSDQSLGGGISPKPDDDSRSSSKSEKLLNLTDVINSHKNSRGINEAFQIIMDDSDNPLLAAMKLHPNPAIQKAFNIFLQQSSGPAKSATYLELVKVISRYTKVQVESFDSAYLVLYRLFSPIPDALLVLNNEIIPNLIDSLITKNTTETYIQVFMKLIQVPNQHLTIIKTLQEFQKDDDTALVRAVDTMIEEYADATDQVSYENIFLIKYHLTLSKQLKELGDDVESKVFLLDSYRVNLQKSLKGLTGSKGSRFMLLNKSSNLIASIVAGTQYNFLNNAFLNPSGGVMVYLHVFCTLAGGWLLNRAAENTWLSSTFFNNLAEINIKFQEQIERSSVDINNAIPEQDASYRFTTIKSFKAEFKQVLSEVAPIIDVDHENVSEIFKNQIEIDIAVEKLNALIDYAMRFNLNPQDLHVKLEFNGKKIRGNLLFWLDYVNRYRSDKGLKEKIDQTLRNIYGLPLEPTQLELELGALECVDQIYINIKNQDRYDTTTMFHKLLMLCRAASPVLKQRIFFYYKARLDDLKIAPRNSFVYTIVNFFLFAGFASGDNFADSLSANGDISPIALITQILPAIVFAGEKLSAKLLKPVLDKLVIQSNVTQQTIHEIVKEIEILVQDNSINQVSDGDVRVRNILDEEKKDDNPDCATDILTNLIGKNNASIGDDDYIEIVKQYINDDFGICYEQIPPQYWQVILTKRMGNVTLFEKLIMDCNTSNNNRLKSQLYKIYCKAFSGLAIEDFQLLEEPAKIIHFNSILAKKFNSPEDASNNLFVLFALIDATQNCGNRVDGKNGGSDSNLELARYFTGKLIQEINNAKIDKTSNWRIFAQKGYKDYIVNMAATFLLCISSTLAIAFTAQFAPLVIFWSYLGIENIKKVILNRYGAMSKFLSVDKQISKYASFDPSYEIDADNYQMSELLHFLESKGGDSFSDSPEYALCFYSYIAKASSKTDLVSRVHICVKWINDNQHIDDSMRSEIKLILKNMLLDWKKTTGFFNIINSFSGTNLYNRTITILKGLIFAVLLPAGKLFIFLGSALVKFIVTSSIIEALILLKIALKRDLYGMLGLRSETYKEVERILNLEFEADLLI